MTIYIDNDYKCYVTDNGTMREFEVDFFDNKCKNFIEGYRYVPTGEIWTREDGTKFYGEMIAPWRNYTILSESQEAFDDANSIVQEKTSKMIGELANGTEKDYIATNNYVIDDLIIINNISYIAIKNIPTGKIMIINQDIVETTIYNYVTEE